MTVLLNFRYIFITTGSDSIPRCTGSVHLSTDTIFGFEYSLMRVSLYYENEVFYRDERRGGGGYE